MKKSTSYLALLFLLLSNQLIAQTIRVCEQISNVPVRDALVIQDGKHLGSTDEKGYCELKGLNVKSKVCIKTFGFIDTCFFLKHEQQEVHLRPLIFQTDEVVVSGQAIPTKEQFLKYYAYSVSQANQEDEVRSYNFYTELTEHSTSAFEKMEGVFSYTHPKVKKRMGFNRLSQCYANHTISKSLLADTVFRYSNNDGGLVYNINNLSNPCLPAIKSLRKTLKQQKLIRENTDTTVVFVYVDSTYYPSKEIWQFDLSGRLLKFESMRILAEANRSILHQLGHQYCFIEYSKKGVLRPERIDFIQTQRSKPDRFYTIKTSLIHHSENCDIEESPKIPFAVSISTWAKMNNVTTTVVDD